MKKYKNLGINIVNLDIDKALDMGLGRLELSLGKEEGYENKLIKFNKSIKKVEKLNIPYSIHLPVYVPAWYTYHHFSAFFIDEDKEKRELSFKLLTYNLEKLKDVSAEYYVLHFPGIAEKWQDEDKFKKTLMDSLDRVNNMAKEYGVKLYLEYFGSNKNFYDYNEWIQLIKPYENLGILTDTGHLYFASIINKFDFYKAAEKLIENSQAFHLWTTKGGGAYCDSEYYNKYHHIGPNINQYSIDGWAFDTEKIVRLMAQQDKPVIIEPSINYKGLQYLLEGIDSIKKYF